MYNSTGSTDGVYQTYFRWLCCFGWLGWIAGIIWIAAEHPRLYYIPIQQDHSCNFQLGGKRTPGYNVRIVTNYKRLWDNAIIILTLLKINNCFILSILFKNQKLLVVIPILVPLTAHTSLKWYCTSCSTCLWTCHKTCLQLLAAILFISVDFSSFGSHSTANGL